MGLSDSSIKKFFKTRKLAFLMFGEMQFLNIFGNKNPKKIPYISGNRTFLYFGKQKPRKNSYISGNRNPKKLLIFLKGTS